MSARHRFCQLVLSKIDSPVLWTAQGPDAFDCSGLVMWALLALGAKGKNGKAIADHTAQMFSDETPALVTAPGATPLPGDLGFYGADNAQVIHVVIWLAGGRILSADGATSRILDLKTAKANPLNRVHLHSSVNYRKGFLGLHRNTFVDALDLVSR